MMKVKNIRGITLYRFIGMCLSLILPVALIFRNSTILFFISLVLSFYLFAFWLIKYYVVNSKGVEIKYVFRFYKTTVFLNYKALHKVTYIYENGTFAEPRLILESNNLKEVLIIFNFRKVRNILEQLRNHEVPILFQTTEYIIREKIKWPYDYK